MSTEIGRHCQTLINLINDRDFDLQNPTSWKLVNYHVSPDWSGRLDDHKFTLSFQQMMEFWEDMTLEYPDLHFELMGVDCSVRKDDRTADCVMHTIRTRAGARFQFACELQWKFSQGRWMWHRSCGFRGLPLSDSGLCQMKLASPAKAPDGHF
jgi:hypothetical protein